MHSLIKSRGSSINCHNFQLMRINSVSTIPTVITSLENTCSVGDKVIDQYLILL